MALTQIELHVHPDAEDLAEELCWIHQATSVSSKPPHEQQRILTALFLTLDVQAFQATLQQAFADQPKAVLSVNVSEVAEDDWQNNWRDNFKPLRIGDFQVVGSWEAPDTPDPKTLLVYPGQAFGTGQHETTQLIIERLQSMDLSGAHMLDAGCGTGILAIAAERLGAASVFGFDIDPDCRENMQHHLEINHTQRTRLDIGALTDFTHNPYDVILANITINVLKILWPDLVGLMKPGAVLLSSGILKEQEAEARTHLQALGLKLGQTWRNGEWVLIEARKA